MRARHQDRVVLDETAPIREALSTSLDGHTLAVSFHDRGRVVRGRVPRRMGTEETENTTGDIRTYVLIPFSLAVCRECGAIRHERRTRTIAVDDAWIAATARKHGSPLVNPQSPRGLPGH